MPLNGTCGRNLAVIVHSPILWPLNLQHACFCTWTTCNSKWTQYGHACVFYQSFYLLWGEKKFKVLVYTGNNNLEYLANLLQSTGTCMLFIFTQSKKWLTKYNQYLRWKKLKVTLMIIWHVNPNCPIKLYRSAANNQMLLFTQLKWVQHWPTITFRLMWRSNFDIRGVNILLPYANQIVLN